MEILEYISDNEIALLINLSDLIEQGYCDKNEIKYSDFILAFPVRDNLHFSYIEIEGNIDNLFDLILYHEGSNGLDIIDIDVNIPREYLKRMVEKRILGI
jgi:hypothetical protein